MRDLGPFVLAAVATACLTLTGCDLLFGVEPRGDAAGAAGDGAEGRADAVIEIDAGIDGSAAADTDNDSVFDDVDNCPAVANATQHDEDADGRGDPCDLCPHRAVNGADFDGDGAGDACDPVPCEAGASILFDAFDDANVAPWTPLGVWAFDGVDQVEAPSDTGALIGPSVGRFGAVELDLRYLFGGNGAAEDYLFGVAIDGDGVDPAVGITCGVLFAGASSTFTLRVWRDGLEIASGGSLGNLPAGRYRVRLSAAEPGEPTKITCTLLSDTLAQLGSLRTDVSGRGPGSRVGIRTESIGAFMRSLTAITSDAAPTPCP